MYHYFLPIGFSYLSECIGVHCDYVEPLKQAFRERRFVVREFSYDESRAGGLDAAVEKGRAEVQQASSTLLRWCKAHFGEVYTGWVHLKVIRSFVEAVLRYGLPPDFLSVFVEPSMRSEKAALTSLVQSVHKAVPELHSKDAASALDEDEVEGEALDSLPFVCQSFTVIGCGPFK